jgi:hypothetical protein
VGTAAAGAAARSSSSLVSSSHLGPAGVPRVASTANFGGLQGLQAGSMAGEGAGVGGGKGVSLKEHGASGAQEPREAVQEQKDAGGLSRIKSASDMSGEACLEVQAASGWVPACHGLRAPACCSCGHQVCRMGGARWFPRIDTSCAVPLDGRPRSTSTSCICFGKLSQLAWPTHCIVIYIASSLT